MPINIIKGTGKDQVTKTITERPVKIEPDKPPLVEKPEEKDKPAEKPPEKEVAKAPTPEELEKQRQDFNQKMWGQRPEKKKEVEKPEKEKPAEPEKQEPEKPADNPKEEKKPDPTPGEGEEGREEKAPKAEVTPQPNVAAGKTMVDQEPPAPSGLSKRQELMLKDLKELENLRPEYRNIVNRTLKFWDTEKAYKESWEKAHPGERYDQEAEEHQSFYEKNEPETDPDELEEAMQSRISKEAEERAVSRMQKSQSVESVKREMKEAAPRIRKEAQKNMFKMVEMAAPDIFEALKANPKKAGEEFDVELEILQEFGEQVEEFTFEMKYLMDYGDHYQPDLTIERDMPSGQVLYPHAMIVKYGKKLQNEIAALPAEKKMRNGKTFMPIWEYSKRIESIQKSDMEPTRKEGAIRDVQSKYWILEADDVKKSFIADKAEEASKRLSKIRGYIEKRSGKTTKQEEGADPAKEEKAEETTVERPGKGKGSASPASLSAFDKVNPGTVGQNKNSASSKMVDQKMWGISS